MTDDDNATDVTERLKDVEDMLIEYEHEAQRRGEEVNAANYRNVLTAVENLRQDIETGTERDEQTDNGGYDAGEVFQ